MLDSVVKLSEKVVELLKYRAERRARKFAHIVQPMFEALKAVHKDYLGIFESADAAIQSSKSLTEIARELNERRIQEEAERRAILASASTFIRDSEFLDLRPFFESVQKYFLSTPLSGGLTPTSLLLQAITRLARFDKVLPAERQYDDRDRESLEQAVQVGLRTLRQNWERVTSEYAATQAAMLK